MREKECEQKKTKKQSVERRLKKRERKGKRHSYDLTHNKMHNLW